MKRTAKNEQTNDQNATKRRRDRGAAEKKTARSVDFSQTLRRSTAALALTCGVCVGVSGCQSFLGSADERFRQGRGEYALNDEAVRRDWEEAAREMGKTTRNGEVGGNGQNGEARQNAEKDPASSRPILRSAAFDDEVEARRVASRKPVAGSPLLAEPEAPKSFGERVKGLFSRPKKESGGTKAKNNVAPVKGGDPAYLGKSGDFIRSDEAKKTARSTGNGFSLGRGLPNVFSSSKRRGREKFPVDPVLQYDESRFMPSFQTCEQYYAPLEPRKPAEQPLTSAKPLKSERATQSASLAQTARTGTVAAAKTTKNRQNASTRVSGRELVADSQKRRASLEDASGWATSGGASSKTSATGWGKTRPISVAANEENATTKTSVAPVGYLNVSRKSETDFQNLTTRCDGFFGWEAADEALLNGIDEPTRGVGESLTAYSTAPSPTASAFSAVAPSAFATEVAAVATGSEQDASTQETMPALQSVSALPGASLPANKASADVGEVASAPSTAPVLTAYSPSATRKNASEDADFASQLGETKFDWFDSQARNGAVQATPETSTVATFEPEITSSVPEQAAENLENETLELISETPRVDLDAALANRLAPVPVVETEVEETAVGLPVAEVGETAGTLPVAVEALDVEAPRALAAVEEVVGEENGVAGPNFALAAPGLGAGEAIQDAADERKNAAVAKPLSGDEIAWVEQIKAAIRTLVAERDAKKAAGEDVRRLDARLRLLYLAVDEYDRSIQEIQDDADPLKVFWENERGDLETLLQSRLEEIDPTFVAERLRAGLDSLSGLCDLQIRKSALVVAPACFGLYEERVEAFKPGETVFAYAELEYVSCRETEEGRLIDVECRWRLLNGDGSELTPVETQRCSNLSETKLRDVVLNVSAPLPSDLAPGTYWLETEVVDMNRPSAKPATKRLELTVVAGENAEKTAE